MATCQNGAAGLLLGNPVRSHSQALVEFDATAGAEARAIPDHASGNPADIWDFGAAQTERITGALPLRFGGEGITRAGQRGEEDGDRQGRGDLTKGLGANDGHREAPRVGRQRCGRCRCRTLDNRRQENREAGHRGAASKIF